MSEAAALDTEQELFFKRLRQETAESHQKLEDNPLSKAILSPSVSEKDYQTYLAALFGLTIACEDQVFPAISHVITDLPDRYKSRLIIDDLLATGLSEAEIDALPVYRFEFSTAAEALGIMYVLEGSTLGGKILYRHIHEVLGLVPENGASYFWGYGAQTGNLWKSFISSLTQFVDENEERDGVIDSAKKTFTIIDNWLGETGRS
ncbi:heme oxygenase [Dyadobacter sp. BE34]|uniref:Heme oxygenase n=1 Tax=Dyadobacter fermentans TaxID=94254 RepID=A0ABU1R710_9BACT|nr:MULTISPECIES: biliverdin-producing heme oxygenase [Dyadobacter]MDR6808375.1 heme oxygenase [Dyadobacter fermentans]MDR7045808.1 heme oxygenase [Dyadobacter sp. BE242]MDR7200121.1 heme oxygenase [Dyadobacter sp. BE34]MDR7218081.1 heme oxygenase [Dyadobacter sp. BE31]MDR7266012.1 heme oxygenase [Dyadobacter sp. BE32]